MFPALAVWAVSRALELPRVKSRVAAIDDRAFALRKRAVRNARHNKAWLAAGATAFALGIGLMAKAARK